MICEDCEAKKGELHEMFCLKERCPFCGGQLVSCGCIHKVLKLTADESKVVDEYIDDTVEPLKSINSRWVDALIKKGRIPF